MYCLEVEIIGEVGDIVIVVKLIQKFDFVIVFLDICIGQYIGFDLLEMLFDFNFYFIFVMVYDEYVFKVFEYSVFDYLFKFIDFDCLLEVI